MESDRIQASNRCQLLYNILFYSGYALWIAGWHISSSGLLHLFGQEVYSHVELIAVNLFVAAIILSMLMDSYIRSPKVLFLLSFALVIAYIAQINQEVPSVLHVDADYLFVKYRLLGLVLLVFASNKAKFTRICISGALSSLLCMLVVFYFSNKGMISNGILETLEGRQRHYLGYIYPTYSALALVNIIMSLFYYYSKVKKLSVRIVLTFCLVICCVLYKLTDTRLAFLIVIMMTVIFSLIKVLRIDIIRIKPILLMVGIGIFPGCSLFSILSSYAYNGKSRVWQLIDRLVSGRLRLDQIAVYQYKIVPWGQRVEFNTGNSGEYFFIDNGYIYVLLLYGSVLFIALMILYTYITYQAIKRDDYILFAWLCLTAIFNIIQHNLLGTIQSTYLAIWMLLEKNAPETPKGSSHCLKTSSIDSN